MQQYSRFLSTSSCRWPSCGSSAFKDKKLPYLYLLIRPPGRPLTLTTSIFHISRIIKYRGRKIQLARTEDINKRLCVIIDNNNLKCTSRKTECTRKNYTKLTLSLEVIRLHSNFQGKVMNSSFNIVTKIIRLHSSSVS